VVVTGEVDYITDGQRTRTVTGGDPLMTRVVGTGCALSAVVAASCSLPGDRLDNVAAACGWMKRAGTVAVAQSRARAVLPARSSMRSTRWRSRHEAD
jgi:hydroxyethylthiazole kinase